MCGSFLKYYYVKTFEVYFLHSKVKSIFDAWHTFESSDDETSNFLIVSSYELFNICQASIIDETLYEKKNHTKNPRRKL